MLPFFFYFCAQMFLPKSVFSVELAALYSVSKGHYSKWISALLHFPPKRGRERWATYYACCCTPCLSSTALAITRRQLRDVFLSPHFFGNWKIGKLRKSHGCLGKQRTANYSWFMITVFILVWWCTSSWQQESETAKIGGGRAHNEVIVNTSQSTKRRFGLLEKNLKRRKERERCKQKKSKGAETKWKTKDDRRKEKKKKYRRPEKMKPVSLSCIRERQHFALTRRKMSWGPFYYIVVKRNSSFFVPLR